MKTICLVLFLIFTLNYEIKAQRAKGTLEDLLGKSFSGNSTTEDTSTTAPFKPTQSSNIPLITTQPPYKPTYASCGDNKICVPFYNCNNDTNTLDRDGTNIIDIRFDDTKPCVSYLEICCSEDEPSYDKPKPTPKPVSGCGKRNEMGIVYKITGNVANEAEYGEFPWMIAVLQQEIVDTVILNIYKCGGSLIHPQVVMSAAHCVYKFDPHDLIVRAGEWDTQTKNEVYPAQDRQIIEIVTHEKFSKAGLHNDIALLFTGVPFSLGEDINTVCLPPPNMNFDTSRCIATGWGKDQFGQKGKYQVIMKKIELPIIPHSDCQSKLRTTRIGQTFNLHESFICAGGENGKDTCKGDGGGPLVCPSKTNNGKYYQSGIVAWGIECTGTSPGVYASVSYLRNWIDNIMTSRSFDSNYYTLM